MSTQRIFLRHKLLFTALALLAAAAPFAWGERASATAWKLLAVAYPDARDVEIQIGGAEKSLTARGTAKVKWRDGTADIALEADQVPSPSELGKGSQLVLWAIDQEKKVVNLGAVHQSGKKVEAKAKAPFRIFGLLVTAEADAGAKSPSTAVALESKLPVNPNLVLPVFRVEIPLGS